MLHRCASIFKLNKKYFFDTLIQNILVLILRMNNLRGDPTDISANKKTLAMPLCRVERSASVCEEARSLADLCCPEDTLSLN